MSPQSQHPTDSMHERTLAAIRQILDRVFDNVYGLEKVVVRQGIQLLYPKVEKRIRDATEEELAVELRNLRQLVDAALNDREATHAPARARAVRPGIKTVPRKRPAQMTRHRGR